MSASRSIPFVLALVLAAACSSKSEGGGGAEEEPGEGGRSGNTKDAGAKKDAPAAASMGGAVGEGGSGAGGAPGEGGAPVAGGATGSGGAAPSGGSSGAVDALETVSVTAAAPVTMKTSLGMGEIFLLRASGLVDLGGSKMDAEYVLSDNGGDDTVANMLDVGVDVGVLQVHAGFHTTPGVAGPERAKWREGFRPDHVYYLTVTGEGKPLTLKLVKPAGSGAGTGAIDVALIKLFPAPPKLGAELETVPIPLTKTVVASKMDTVAGKLYVLQAAGRGKVGGGGTHEGDAEYMDWDEAGTKKNEGEAGADFGIGVDEIVVGMKGANGASYEARKRWWGLWRMDHTYYMVFTGTGKPIQFLYFDSGYGDNAKDVNLTVKIFAAP
jgi:hypothetical protein